MIRWLSGWRPTRYVIIGGICAVAHNVIMIGGDWIGFHYLLSSLISFLLVTPLGYVLHSAFTFKETMSARGFARFAWGIALGFPISILTMAILCSGFGVPVAIAAPVATVILFVWNYACAHWAILGRLRVADAFAQVEEKEA